jgi:hypothetical protein
MSQNNGHLTVRSLTTGEGGSVRSRELVVCSQLLVVKPHEFAEFVALPTYLPSVLWANNQATRVLLCALLDS